MSVWSARRRLFYTLIFLIPILILVLILSYSFFYKTPTCFDGLKNGEETGIDCGGVCSKECEEFILEPIVLWERSFEVTDNVYNAVAYVENPNINSEVKEAFYSFKFYSEKNILLDERVGTVSIPAGRKVAIFEGPIILNESVLDRTVFEFSPNLDWRKKDSVYPSLSIKDEKLFSPLESPRLKANVTNVGVSSLKDVSFVALISDYKGKVIHASKTLVEQLGPRDSKEITFTWPEPFDAGISTCLDPVDVVLAIDRSGSMDDDNDNPPQPLTLVKRAASGFVDRMQPKDQVGVVSFATSASETPDSELSNNFSETKNSIGGLQIKTDGIQHTNIADGILFAQKELLSERQNIDAKKVLILLTDGIASRPLKEGNDSYAEDVAKEFAKETKSQGIEVFSIGLGESVNGEFLSEISSTPGHYYNAPNSSDVAQIYQDIASAICERVPTSIEIIPVLSL